MLKLGISLLVILFISSTAMGLYLTVSYLQLSIRYTTNFQYICTLSTKYNSYNVMTLLAFVPQFNAPIDYIPLI